MSNYTPTTSFTALTTAHAVINGAPFDTEFANIATAIATKVDSASFFPTIATKVASTSITSSVTLTQDPTFALPITVTVGQPTYKFEIYAQIANVGGVPGGFQGSMFYVGGAPSQVIYNMQLSSGASFYSAQAVTIANAISGTGLMQASSTYCTGGALLYVNGTITVASSGTLALAWAQNSSSATATTLLTNGMMILTRIQ
jgi:hypothetical protein